MTGHEKHAELIEAAINYWVQYLYSPKYTTDSTTCTLPEREAIYMMHASLLVNGDTHLTKEQIDTFKRLLKEFLETEADAGRNCSLETEWGVEPPLSHFLRDAEIPGTFFPPQTIMYTDFTKGVLKVQHKQIYPVVKVAAL
jgi:hypothetical protein